MGSGILRQEKLLTKDATVCFEGEKPSSESCRNLLELTSTHFSAADELTIKNLFVGFLVELFSISFLNLKFSLLILPCTLIDGRKYFNKEEEEPDKPSTMLTRVVILVDMSG